MKRLKVATIVLGLAALTVPATAEGDWWFGPFKPSGDAAGKVTGELDMSPDYLFLISDREVSVLWQNLACDAKACLFKVMEPKALSLKGGKAVCGGKAVAFVNVQRSGPKDVKVSLQTSLSPDSACLTGVYKPKFG